MLPIADALRFGWEGTKKHFWSLLGLYVLFYLIQFGAAFALTFLAQWNEQLATGLGMLVNLVANVVMPTGSAAVALRICDGLTFKLEDFLCDGRILLFFLAEMFLVGAILVAGFLCLIVPGVYLAIRLSQCTYYIVEQKNDPIEALKNSWEATRGMAGPLFVYFLAVVGLMFGGLLLLVVGVIPAWFVTTIASAYLYRVLNRRLAAPKKDPSTPAPILVES
jgi:uncharacterized membrane protein